MADLDFQVGGKNYRATRLSAIDALDISRKWAQPLIYAAGTDKPDFGVRDFMQAFAASATKRMPSRHMY